MRDSAASRESVEIPPHMHQHAFSNLETQGFHLAQQGRRYDRLRKQGATEFSGSIDPMVAETWLKKTERILNLMKCDPEAKRDYAVSLLQDDAIDWWETIPNHLNLTWEDFLREFREKYMPEVYRDEKQKEFLNLRQGPMTVAEYEIQFTRLSHYARHMIEDERNKCRRYEEGLNIEIRRMITSIDLENFQRLRAAAIRAEKLMEPGREKYNKDKNKIETSSRTGKRKSESELMRLGIEEVTRGSAVNIRESFSKAPSYGDDDYSQEYVETGPANVSSERPHSNENQRLNGACFKCGKHGHHIRDCPRNWEMSRTCYRCGRYGHLVRECPVERPKLENELTARGRGRGRTINTRIQGGRSHGRLNFVRKGRGRTSN